MIRRHSHLRPDGFEKHLAAHAFTLVCGKEWTPSTDQLIVNEIELEFGAPGLFTTKVAVPIWPMSDAGIATVK